jgi:hypothetical protein
MLHFAIDFPKIVSRRSLSCFGEEQIPTYQDPTEFLLFGMRASWYGSCHLGPDRLQGSLALINALLDAGADVNLTCTRGTPLQGLDSYRSFYVTC